jgi:hypothetical protein
MRRLTGFLGFAALLAVVLTPSAAAFEFDEASRIPPGGIVGQPYKFAFVIEEGGGCPPYTFHVQMGPVPPGLTLVEEGDEAGKLSGTPTAAGTYDFWLQALDSAPGGCGNPPTRPKAHTELLMTIRIMPALTIDQQALRATLVKAPYSVQLTATGGGTPTWSLSSGALPPGITFSSSGLLSGTPTATGSYTFSITVVDIGNFDRRDTNTYTLNVVEPLTANAPESTPAEVSRPFSWTPTVAGGTAPYAWALAQGTLPAGLSLDAGSGRISGAPTAAGTFSGTLSVTDANGLRTTLAFALHVDPKLAIATRRLGSGKVGRLYRASVKTRGGVLPLRWDVSGKLPPGVRFNSSTGSFTGKAQKAGIFRVTVQVRDRLGAAAKQALAINVLR